MFQSTLKKIPRSKNSTGCALESHATKHKICKRATTTHSKAPAQMKNKSKKSPRYLQCSRGHQNHKRKPYGKQNETVSPEIL